MGVPYEFREFPKRKYHDSYLSTDRSTLVHNVEEEAALEDGPWHDTPATCPAPPKKKDQKPQRFAQGPAGHQVAIDPDEAEDAGDDSETDSATTLEPPKKRKK